VKLKNASSIIALNAKSSKFGKLNAKYVLDCAVFYSDILGEPGLLLQMIEVFFNYEHPSKSYFEFFLEEILVTHHLQSKRAS
jgi:hypothetical protein